MKCSPGKHCDRFGALVTNVEFSISVRSAGTARRRPSCTRNPIHRSGARRAILGLPEGRPSSRPSPGMVAGRMGRRLAHRTSEESRPSKDTPGQWLDRGSPFGRCRVTAPGGTAECSPSPAQPSAGLDHPCWHLDRSDAGASPSRGGHGYSPAVAAAVTWPAYPARRRTVGFDHGFADDRQ